MDYNEMTSTILKRRIELQLSQFEVAKRAKVSIKVIDKIESGNFGKILLKTFIRVLHALDLKIVIVDRKEGL
jgi:cytoskeletal protein RodZ